MGAGGLLNLGAAMVRCYPPPDAAAQAAAVFAPGMAPTDAQLQQMVTNNLGTLANTLGTLVAIVMWGLGIWWLTVRWAVPTRRSRLLTAMRWLGWWLAGWLHAQRAAHHCRQLCTLHSFLAGGMGAGGGGQRGISVPTDVFQYWVVGEWA